MSDALQDIEAEADAAPEGAVVALVTEVGEFEVTVPPAGTWRTLANRALRQGDFDEWAELVLTEDDYDTWCEAETTLADVEDFFTAWKQATGESRPKSSRRQGSSRSTRRR